MPYLGNQPTAVPIQSSDLADGIVSNAKLGTDISAAKLVAGTLADARFPATLPALNGSALTNLDASDLTGPLPAISGASLTNLDAGKILQVQHMTTSTQTEVTATSYSDTAITDTITPSATSSKILILITDSCQYFNKPGHNDNGMGFRLKRAIGGSGTTVYQDNQPYEGFYHSTATGDPNFRQHMTFTAIDSPNTTSECTYTHQISVYRSGSGAKARSVHDSNRGNMILLEIGA